MSQQEIQHLNMYVKLVILTAKNKKINHLKQNVGNSAI